MDSLQDNPNKSNRLTLLETRDGNPKINTLDHLRTLRLDTVFDLESVHRYRLRRESLDRGSTITASNLEPDSRPAEAGSGYRDAKRPILHSFADASRYDTAPQGEPTTLTYGIPGSSNLQSAAVESRFVAGSARPVFRNTLARKSEHTAETSVSRSDTKEGDTRPDPQAPGSSTLPSASNPSNSNLGTWERETILTPAGSDPRMERLTPGRSNSNLAFQNGISPPAARDSWPESQHLAPGTPKSDTTSRKGRTGATPQAPRAFTSELARTAPSPHRPIPPSSPARKPQELLLNPDIHHIQNRVIRILNPRTNERHDRALNIAPEDPFLRF